MIEPALFKIMETYQQSERVTEIVEARID